MVGVVVALLIAASGCQRHYRIDLAEADDEVAMGRAASVADAGEDHVRFVAVGDAGLGNDAQAAVAAGVQEACDGRCDFVILLGDNLYDEGIATEADKERIACIVDRYPSDAKYLTLGNHDYHKVLPKMERARAQLDWIREADGARGAFHFYQFTAGLVDVTAVDTNVMVRGRIAGRYAELARFLGPLRPSSGRWSIVFGHHPYSSQGTHGDAGQYVDGGLEIWRGEFFRSFMDRHVVGRADLYIAGHDHNLQFFPNLAGQDTAQIVSGSGAKCQVRRGQSEGEATMEYYGYGFALVDATPSRLTVTFHDYRGRAIWGTTRTRQSPTWKPIAGAPEQSIDPRNHCNRDRRALTDWVRRRKLVPCAVTIVSGGRIDGAAAN